MTELERELLAAVQRIDATYRRGGPHHHHRDGGAHQMDVAGNARIRRLLGHQPHPAADALGPEIADHVRPVLDDLTRRGFLTKTETNCYIWYPAEVVDALAALGAPS